MIAVITTLGGFAGLAWIVSVALAARAARLHLPWSPTNGGGPQWQPRRDELAASARVWSIGLGSLATIAVLAAVALAVSTR